MSNVSIKNLFLEQKYEEILETNISILENSNLRDLDTDLIQVLVKSLINAGYYLKAIDILVDYFNQRLSIPFHVKISFSYLLCESYLASINFSEGKKILAKIRLLLDNISEADLRDKDENEISYIIYQALFNRNPKNINYAIEAVTQFIRKLENSNRLSELALFSIKKGVLFRLNEDYYKMLKTFEESMRLCRLINDNLGLAECYYQIGLSYHVLDELDLSINNFSEAKKIYKDLGLKNKELRMITRIGEAYSKKGELYEAIEIFQTDLNDKLLFKNDFNFFFNQEMEADNYNSIGELDKALTLYSNLDDFYKKTNRKLLGGILNKIGTIKASQGFFEEGLLYHKQALDIFAEINDILGIPWSKIYYGECLFEMGNFDGALKIWLESYEQLGAINNNHGLAYASNKIGLVYLILNDNNSQVYFTKALELFKDTQKFDGILVAFIGLGIFYAERNSLKKANNYFSKASEILTDNVSQRSGISDIFFKLALLSIEHSLGTGLGYIDLLSSYLDHLTDTPRNLQRKKFIQAVKLNSTPRLQEKLEAMKLFKELTTSNLLDYEITIISYLFIFEYLIFELKIFNNKEILQDANNILEEINEYTLAYNLSFWKARILSLQAQIKLFEFDFNEAKALINEAIHKAASKNLNRLAFQLSNQYDDMVNQIVRLEELKKNEIPDIYNEILEITDFSVFDINRNKFNFEIAEEEPAYISLISATGVTLFSHNFQSGNSEKENFDQLMSGFLIAINSVIMKLFSSTGFIERIKHKEYTIALFNLVESIYICYAYKGSSYHAQTKLNELKEELKLCLVIKELNESVENNKTLNKKDSEIIERIIKELFESKVIST